MAKAADLLNELGHELVAYAYPDELDFGSWMDTLWMYDVVHEINRRSDELGRRPEAGEIDAMTRYLLELVDASSAMDHYRARLLAHQNSVRQMTSMAGLDLLLTPSLGSDPVPLGSFDSHSEAFDYDRWTAQGWAFAPFSYICNMTGQPAASLPLRLAADEPPCAVQLAGHHGQDHLLLQVSAQLEQQLQWADYRPPIRVGD